MRASSTLWLASRSWICRSSGRGTRKYTALVEARMTFPKTQNSHMSDPQKHRVTQLVYSYTTNGLIIILCVAKQRQLRVKTAGKSDVASISLANLTVCNFSSMHGSVSVWTIRRYVELQVATLHIHRAEHHLSRLFYKALNKSFPLKMELNFWVVHDWDPLNNNMFSAASEPHLLKVWVQIKAPASF